MVLRDSMIDAVAEKGGEEVEIGGIADMPVSCFS